MTSEMVLQLWVNWKGNWSGVGELLQWKLNWYILASTNCIWLRAATWVLFVVILLIYCPLTYSLPIVYLPYTDQFDFLCSRSSSSLQHALCSNFHHLDQISTHTCNSSTAISCPFTHCHFVHKELCDPFVWSEVGLNFVTSWTLNKLCLFP